LNTYIYLPLYQVLRDELQARQSKIHQLQIENNEMKPKCLEYKQQLDTSKRINKQVEDELILYKNKVAEIHNYESEQFNNK
jgi:hypothetical protein